MADPVDENVVLPPPPPLVRQETLNANEFAAFMGQSSPEFSPRIDGLYGYTLEDWLELYETEREEIEDDDEEEEDDSDDDGDCDVPPVGA
jgi:hypothetical protein